MIIHASFGERILDGFRCLFRRLRFSGNRRQPKELFIVPGAGHVDLYDRVNLIPFDKLTKFFRDNLKYEESITSR